MKNVAIIIPAYNESLTIEGVIHQFYAQMPEAYQVIVDNRSSDGTGEIASRVMAELDVHGEVMFEGMPGKGNALKRAFREVEAQVYVIVDADLTYFASDLPALLAPVLSGQADMVVGDRLSRGAYAQSNSRRFHEFGNGLVRTLINVLFGAKLSDILSGYRVFSRRFVKNFPILSDGFEIETEMTLHSLDKKFRVLELPISYQDRPEGSFSKLSTSLDGFRVLKAILMIFKDYKPLIFFSSLALIFLVAGLACGTPVMVEFWETRFITHLPLAVLASSLMIGSFLFFSVGLILDTVVTQHRRNYVLSLMRYS